MPAMLATKDDPTDPRDPTRYPSATDFHTSFWAMMYMTANPLEMMECSSFFRRSSTTCGRSSP